MVEDIDSIQLFDDLSLRKKSRLRQCSKLQTFKRGDYIYLPGDAGEAVYVIDTGRVKLAKISESGKELTLAFYTNGDIFGETTLLNESPRSTLAQAVDKSTVWHIPRAEFLDISSSSPRFSMQLSSIIGQRRHDLEIRMENLVFRDVRSRLASQILTLAEQHGRRRVDGSILIDLKLSQLDLANLIGATRETTSTVINDMKRDGILETSHRTLIIRDYDSLSEIKDFI